MKCHVLPAGVKRYVHVLVSALHHRFQTGEKVQLVCVRSAKRPGAYKLYRKVECLGPASLEEIETPLPGTNGRGICVMVTDAPLRVFTDF